MTEEEKAWHKVAGRLGKSVGEAKQSMTRREMLRWVIFIQEEWAEPSRLDHQIAQNSWVLWCIWSLLTGSKTQKDVNHFLMKFKFVKKALPTPIDGLTQEEVDKRIASNQDTITKMNRANLAACLGLAEMPAEGKVTVDLTGTKKPSKTGKKAEKASKRKKR